MSAGVEGNRGVDSATQPPSAEVHTASPVPPAHASRHLHARRGVHHHEHHDHHVLIEADEDRWEWRRKIRRDPRKLVAYRCVVACAGLLMIGLGFVTGPLPGPGGIPLVLLGLAIWSSEFEWAYKLMQRFKRLLFRYSGWHPRRKIVFWIVFFVCCGLLGYLYLLVIGVPPWAPPFAVHLLQHLPGVEIR